MGRWLVSSLTFTVILLYITSCSPTKDVSYECQSSKIKFDFNLLEENGYHSKTHQPIDYEFCIPDNEIAWKEVLAINPQLKKANSKGRSNCGINKLLVIGNTDNKAFKRMLCKIANLDYVKEVNQTHWE